VVACCTRNTSDCSGKPPAQTNESTYHLTTCLQPLIRSNALNRISECTAATTTTLTAARVDSAQATTLVMCFVLALDTTMDLPADSFALPRWFVVDTATALAVLAFVIFGRAESIVKSDTVVTQRVTDTVIAPTMESGNTRIPGKNSRAHNRPVKVHQMKHRVVQTTCSTLTNFFTYRQSLAPS
jgi:hypothetical protein